MTVALIAIFCGGILVLAILLIYAAIKAFGRIINIFNNPKF